MPHTPGITWRSTRRTDGVSLAGRIAPHAISDTHIDDGLGICRPHGTRRTLIGTGGWFVATEYRDRARFVRECTLRFGS